MINWASSRLGLSVMGEKASFSDYLQFFTRFQTAFNYPNHGWNGAALTAVYCKGLCTELQLELACQDAGLTLDQQIQMSICLDQHVRSRSGNAVGKPVKA